MLKNNIVNIKIETISFSTQVALFLRPNYDILLSEQLFQSVHEIRVVFYRYSGIKIVRFFVIIIEKNRKLTDEYFTHFRSLVAVISPSG